MNAFRAAVLRLAMTLAVFVGHFAGTALGGVPGGAILLAVAAGAGCMVHALDTRGLKTFTVSKKTIDKCFLTWYYVEASSVSSALE